MTSFDLDMGGSSIVAVFHSVDLAVVHVQEEQDKMVDDDHELEPAV